MGEREEPQTHQAGSNDRFDMANRFHVSCEQPEWGEKAIRNEYSTFDGLWVMVHLHSISHMKSATTGGRVNWLEGFKKIFLGLHNGRNTDQAFMTSAFFWLAGRAYVIRATYQTMGCRSTPCKSQLSDFLGLSLHGPHGFRTNPRASPLGITS